MKEISFISLDRLNNGAHYQLMVSALERALTDEKITSTTQTTALLGKFQTAVDEENANLVLSQKSFYTDEISAADATRDALYRSYKRSVKAYADFPDEEVATAAKVLLQHIKDYGIDPQMQLDRETGLLTNFIADLQEKYAEQVATLSLTPFVTKIATANEQVIAYTTKRTEERMSIPLGALKNARLASDTAYHALMKMVNALALVFGEADYADFIDYMNTLVVHYKREVLGQKATASTDTTTEEESDDSSDSSSDNEESGSSSSGSSSSGSESSGGSSSSGGDSNPL